jgi:hypothetical protein
MKTALIVFAVTIMAATGQTNDDGMAGGNAGSAYAEISIGTNVYQLETNYWYGVTTNILCDNYSIEAMREHGITNIVKTLAEAGEICKVFGHSWRDGRPGEGEGSAYGGWYADYHPGVIYRTCRICGKPESRSTGDWK